MAVKNRADLQISIDTNLPDNTTEAITPATHRIVEEDLKDSNYNLLDNAATDVTYNPTTVTDWQPEEPTGPTEVGGALDILATRTKFNPSDNIIYVSDTGNDTTAEEGNPLKPFGTFAAAISAVPTNGYIKLLGGVYTDNFVINKNNFTLDIQGCDITGNIQYTATAGVLIIGYNATMRYNSPVNTGLFIIGNPGLTVRGGTYIGLSQTSCVDQQVPTGGGTFIDCVLTCSSTPNADKGCVNANNNSYFENCDIQTTGANTPGVRVTGTGITGATLKGCKIVSTNLGLRIADTTVKIDNCEITGNNAIAGQDTAGYECNVLITNNSIITATAGRGLILVRNCEKVLIQDSRIYSTGDCIDYLNTNVLRLNNAVNVYKSSYFRSTGGSIITENYNAGDTGDAEFLNCITNVALGVLTKVTETNTVTNANLQDLD